MKLEVDGKPSHKKVSSAVIRNIRLRWVASLSPSAFPVGGTIIARYFLFFMPRDRMLLHPWWASQIFKLFPARFNNHHHLQMMKRLQCPHVLESSWSVDEISIKMFWCAAIIACEGRFVKVNQASSRRLGEAFPGNLLKFPFHSKESNNEVWIMQANNRASDRMEAAKSGCLSKVTFCKAKLFLVFAIKKSHGNRRPGDI